MGRTPWRAGRPSQVALLTLALGLVSWRALDRGRWPTGGIEPCSHERLLWSDDGASPLGLSGDLDTADVVIVGDSRVANAVHLSIASSLGVGDIALVWLSAAQLTSLLQPLLDVDAPRNLVVALSPLGLVRYPGNVAITETVRVKHPAAEPSSPPHVVRRWAESERAHLVERGFPPAVAQATIDWWVRSYRDSRRAWLAEQRWFNTERLDAALNHRVDRWRSIALGSLEPTSWPRAWRKAPNPRASDLVYRQVVDRKRAAEHAEGAAQVAAQLAQLQARGWRIACVRLPIDPGLRELEDSTGCGPLLASIPSQLGLPYYDFGPWPGSTNDGSHLNWRAADRCTRELARWLHDDLGWRPGPTAKGPSVTGSSPGN